MKILIFEDDKNTGEYLRKRLCEARYSVELTTAGTEGGMAPEHDYNAIVLDVIS